MSRKWRPKGAAITRLPTRLPTSPTRTRPTGGTPAVGRVTKRLADPARSAGESGGAELTDPLAVEAWGDVLVEQLGGEFSPAGDLEFGVDGLDVIFDGVPGNPQRLGDFLVAGTAGRSEEHTSELQS